MRTNLYLDLLKTVLTDLHRIEKGEYIPIAGRKPTSKQRLLLPFNWILEKGGFSICKFWKPDVNERREGTDWPTHAETMIGIKRLNNLQYCIEEVLEKNVEGDFIETGVWRGGGVIFMRAVLKANGVTDRTVWVADSFEGLPKPNAEKYIHDTNDPFHTFKALCVSQKEVEANFRKYDLLDNQVKFLKGWFKDTLHRAPINKLWVLRLDGDMYESTMDALTSLYPKLSSGGFVIIDDYHSVNGCKMAVADYRKSKKITDPILDIDQGGVYWKKQALINA